MKIGIVGLPNVGKSTLFNALTKNNVLAANYPFATIEPNVGIVPLPDDRLQNLSEIYNNAPIVPATVTFVDIAGIVRGASEGQGLGNKFLSHIRESNAIVQVVRAFSDPNVAHVDETPHPKRDIETIQTELILADLEAVDKRLAKVVADMKKDPKSAAAAKNVLEKIKLGLGKGQLATSLGLNEKELEAIHDLSLLTAKPFIYVFNVDEADLANATLQEDLARLTGSSPALFLCAKTEAELMELAPDEAAELLAELGQDQSGLNKLASVSFDILGLQAYLTAGPKEVRAWTIKKGSSAPQAAGVIHTDFEKGFIRAEIVNYADLINSGSLVAARSSGKVRLEGKDYIVQPGDVIEFRFNV